MTPFPFFAVCGRGSIEGGGGRRGAGERCGVIEGLERSQRFLPRKNGHFLQFVTLRDPQLIRIPQIFKFSYLVTFFLSPRDVVNHSHFIFSFQVFRAVWCVYVRQCEYVEYAKRATRRYLELTILQCFPCWLSQAYIWYVLALVEVIRIALCLHHMFCK